MQVKFVKTDSMRELEATANFLLLEGWEMGGPVVFLPNGDYFIQFVKYAPTRRGYASTELCQQPVAIEPCGGETLR